MEQRETDVPQEKGWLQSQRDSWETRKSILSHNVWGLVGDIAKKVATKYAGTFIVQLITPRHGKGSCLDLSVVPSNDRLTYEEANVRLLEAKAFCDGCKEILEKGR